MRKVSREARFTVARMVTAFLIFSIVWIIASDQVVAAVAPTVAQHTTFQTAKGSAYVIVVAVAMGMLCLQGFARIETAYRREQAANIEILKRLAFAAEFRDEESGAHNTRIGIYAGRVAQEMGLDPCRCDRIMHAAALHDVGKIAIPDAILRKPGKLTPTEYAEMQRHVEAGWEILKGPGNEFVRTAATIARYHHERWDGSGYPVGLAGVEIPLEARIVAVCDVFDALISARPYKDAWPLEAALGEIARQSGRHFDPDVVQAFLNSVGNSEGAFYGLGTSEGTPQR